MRFEGADIVLGPLRDEDSDVLFRWINNRELVIHSAQFHTVERCDHDEWFDSIRRRDDVRIFGIRLRSDDTLVGSCQLHSISTAHNTAELQIRIGESSQQNRGYGSQAVRLLLDYGFKELGLHRVWVHVLSSNGAAISVYEKAGFIREGRLREAACIENSRVDLIILGILRREYELLD